jgi:beta-N-acetylhexosaminidase
MDVVLHCNGDLAEMRSLLPAVPVLSGAAAERWVRAEAMRHAPEPADIAALTTRLAEFLGMAQA